MYKIGFFLISLMITSLSFAKPCHTQRQVYIENAEVKVWQTKLCPHELLAYHNHQFPRVLIPQTDGELQVVYKSGVKKSLILKKQQPIYLDIAQGKELHQDINLSNQIITVVVIELKQNKKRLEEAALDLLKNPMPK